MAGGITLVFWLRSLPISAFHGANDAIEPPFPVHRFLPYLDFVGSAIPALRRFVQGSNFLRE